VVSNGVALTDSAKLATAITATAAGPRGAAVRRGVLAAALLIALSPATGCAFAVKHPAAAAGIVGGTLAFGTCKLASDNYGACAAVGGGAGAFLGLVAATALWLGGDGHTVLIEDQAQPLPDDGRPIKRRRRAPVAPDAPVPAPEPSPDPASQNPTSQNPAAPSPAPSEPPAPAATPPSPAPDRP
jgi:hypothetical protein